MQSVSRGHKLACGTVNIAISILLEPRLYVLTHQAGGHTQRGPDAREEEPSGSK